MAFNDNSANNWFGQVGGGRVMQPRQQVAAPTLSQIPGLSKATADLSLSEGPARQLFKDTDSAYVRLAKQGGRSDLLRMDHDSQPTGHAPEGRALPDWLQRDMANHDDNENFAATGDGLLNGYNPDQWEARRDNFMPDDQYSISDWSRKTSAEGGRQYIQPEPQANYSGKYIQPEPQANYSGKYSENANWQDDPIQLSQQRRPMSPVAAGVMSGTRANDNGRPEWLQPSPSADGQKDSNYGKSSPGVRYNEENLDDRYSPSRRRYSGQNSSQRPFADHGYQVPMMTETGSAFSEKQLPGDRRSSLKQSNDAYDHKEVFQTTPQKPYSQASDQQLSFANRMKRSDSMSKLLSFGYLRDAENENSLKSRTPSHPRIDSGYIAAETYKSEYKDKMHSNSNSTTKAPQNELAQPAYVPTLISDPSYRKRKQSVEERPDFFRIGSTDSQSLLNHNSQKLSAEAPRRPDIFTNDRIANTSAVSYGKTKRELECKPDFFTIGSLDNYVDKQVQQTSNEGGILDKLNGYGIAQKTNFRRRKTDFNTPTVVKPVKAVSRF